MPGSPEISGPSPDERGETRAEPEDSLNPELLGDVADLMSEPELEYNTDAIDFDRRGVGDRQELRDQLDQVPDAKLKEAVQEALDLKLPHYEVPSKTGAETIVLADKETGVTLIRKELRDEDFDEPTNRGGLRYEGERPIARFIDQEAAVEKARERKAELEAMLEELENPGKIESAEVRRLRANVSKDMEALRATAPGLVYRREGTHVAPADRRILEGNLRRIQGDPKASREIKSTQVTAHNGEEARIWGIDEKFSLMSQREEVPSKDQNLSNDAKQSAVRETIKMIATATAKELIRIAIKKLGSFIEAVA